MKCLDLFCGGGGAGAGYAKAGFEVTGVDINPHPNYPQKFIQDDFFEFMFFHDMSQYDFIHASPPCQLYSCSTSVEKAKGKKYPDFVNLVRKELDRVGKPYVIENVMQAPIRKDIILRGDMFGLKVLRTRAFELGNWFALNPCLPIKKGIVGKEYVCVYGKAGYKKSGKNQATKPEWAKKTIRETWAYAMGIEHHMTDIEISESIPPAYTHYIGNLFMEQFLISNK